MLELCSIQFKKSTPSRSLVEGQATVVCILEAEFLPLIAIYECNSMEHRTVEVVGVLVEDCLLSMLLDIGSMA